MIKLTKDPKKVVRSKRRMGKRGMRKSTQKRHLDKDRKNEVKLFSE
jgi:hypothetical protein